MAMTEKDFTLTKNTREGIRKELIDEFLQEAPGTGIGDDCSKYRYTVETFNDYSIEIRRPASLNKGFDFKVHIVGVFFKKIRRHSDPSHKDIKNALNEVKSKNTANYNKVKTELANIYSLKQYDLRNVAGITFLDGDKKEQPIELILLSIKWLFIEQDMTYWNWSGRNMLWSKLKEDNLV